MTSDPEVSRSNPKIHRFSSFLGLFYPNPTRNALFKPFSINFEEKLESEQLGRKHIFFKIVKRTVFNQFFELDDEEDGFRKRGTCFIQRIHLKD